MSTPTLALSVRQPWAWLILNAGKDIENRTWRTKVRGRVLIHASKTLWREDLQNAMRWIALNPRIPLNFAEPPFEELLRGGIIGEVEIADCVNCSESAWFAGPYGFVLRNAKVLPFQPCRGRLGFFRPAGLR
jgi:hypothetical protein